MGLLFQAGKRRCLVCRGRRGFARLADAPRCSRFARRGHLCLPIGWPASGWCATVFSIRRERSPMPADRQARISRRAVLTGLGALLAAGCGGGEFMAANVPAVFGAYRRHPNISYGAEPQHRLDVYVPDQAPTGPRPLVVFWHGGRWEFGDKADYRFVGAALAELGYVAVLPNYRHYPQVKMP